MSNSPITLTRVFAALEQMGYSVIQRSGSLVGYDRLQVGVVPSPAVFDTSRGSITLPRLNEALESAGIDPDAFFAILEGMG